MNAIDLLVQTLQGNLGMLTATLADFSDADMLVRPCPGANHAAWQLGHLCGGETMFGSTLKAAGFPELPAGFKDKFTKETAAKDDAAFFPKKAELLAVWMRQRQASIEAIKSLNPDDLAKATTGRLANFAPNLGAVAQMMSIHTTMHVGQFQVIRRKLGKPILF